MNNSLKGLYCLDFSTVDVKGLMMALKIFKVMSKVWPKDLKTTILLLPQCVALHAPLISAFRKSQGVANALKF